MQLDVLSLFPLDLMYFVPALKFNTLLRLPRLLKVRFFFTFMDRFESRSSYPNLFRATKTYMFMVYLVHLTACLYFAVSVWEGINSNRWVYNGEGNSYVRCFYWALVTICSIGANLNPPANSFEYFFHAFCYLFGLFALSTVIGQIRSAMDNASAKRVAYQKRLRSLNDFMQRQEVDAMVQYRVRRWMTYLWENEQIDEIDAYLDCLPINMKAGLAMHAHLDTLSRVSLFRDCEEVLRQELVLKLCPVWYLPGDYICRRGDVGKEMYILNKGEVQVKIENDSGKEQTVAVLYPGSVFGEISLLSIRDNNRRTAHVVSQWFSQLFVLRKRDMQDVLENYPGAKDVLMRKAINLLQRDKDRKKPPEESHSMNLPFGNANVALKAFTQLHDKVRRRGQEQERERGKHEDAGPRSIRILTADHLAVPRGKSAAKRQPSETISVPRMPTSRPASQASRLSVKPAIQSDSQSSLGSFLSAGQGRFRRTDSASSAGSWLSEAASMVGAEERPLILPQISVASQEPETNREGEHIGVQYDSGGRTHLRPRTDADYDAMSLVSALLDENAIPSLPNGTDPVDSSDVGGRLPRISIDPTDFTAIGRSASRCIRYDEQEDEEEETQNEDTLGVTIDTHGTAHLRPKSRADYETMSTLSAMLDVGAFDKR
jgi:CRP-like cAMP-binding protein